MIFFIPRKFKISPCLTVLISSFAIHLLRFNDRKSLTHGKKLGPKFIFSTNFLIDIEQPGNGNFPFTLKISLKPGLSVMISNFVIHLHGLKDRKSLIYGKTGPRIHFSTNLLIDFEQHGNCDFPLKSSLKPGLIVLIFSFVIHLLSLKDRKSLNYSWQKAGPKIHS